MTASAAPPRFVGGISARHAVRRSPAGLVVPVLRNTETMSFADIEKNIGAYAAKARDGSLSLEEMSGGSFTISNGGVFGSLMGTPILNPPQSGDRAGPCP